MRYLTKVRHLVLLKSTLATLLVFMFSLLVVPSLIINKLENFMRNFLWGSMLENKKFHLFSWNQVCVSMEWGSLGKKRLSDVNISLLCEWLWAKGRTSFGNRLFLRSMAKKKEAGLLRAVTSLIDVAFGKE